MTADEDTPMNRIFVAVDDELEVFEQEGVNWKHRLGESARAIECLAIHPDRPDVIYLGSFEEGIHRSSDGGHTFERIEAGFEETAVTCLTVDPNDPNTVIAGTEPSALHRSIDGGDTWNSVGNITSVPSANTWSFPPRPDTHHVRWVEIDPHDPHRWYVGIEAGALLVTPDSGETWMDRPTGALRDIHTLASHADAPERVYAAAGDGYAESRDGGATWESLDDGLSHRYVWGLAVDPGDPNTRLVSAAHGARRAHRPSTAASVVYRRYGNGKWKRLDETALPVGDGVLRYVLAAGESEGEFVAASNRGIYRTETAGDSWRTIDKSWGDRHGSQAVRAVAVS